MCTGLGLDRLFFPGVALSGTLWGGQTMTRRREHFVDVLRCAWTAPFQNPTRSHQRLYKAAELIVLPGQ